MLNRFNINKHLQVCKTCLVELKQDFSVDYRYMYSLEQENYLVTLDAEKKPPSQQKDCNSSVYIMHIIYLLWTSTIVYLLWTSILILNLNIVLHSILKEVT